MNIHFKEKVIEIIETEWFFNLCYWVIFISIVAVLYYYLHPFIPNIPMEVSGFIFGSILGIWTLAALKYINKK